MAGLQLAQGLGREDFELGVGVVPERFGQGLVDFGTHASGTIQGELGIRGHIVGPGFPLAVDLDFVASFAEGLAGAEGVGAVGSGEAVLPSCGFDLGDFEGVGTSPEVALHGVDDLALEGFR